MGALLGDATFEGSGAPVTGSDAIEQMLRNTVIVYDDGTPRTRHVTTNVVIEADDEAGTALARAANLAVSRQLSAVRGPG